MLFLFCFLLSEASGNASCQRRMMPQYGKLRVKIQNKSQHNHFFHDFFTLFIISGCMCNYSANNFFTYNYRIISRKFLPKDEQKWENRTIWLSQMSRAELAPAMPWRQPNKQREQSQACLSYAESRMRSDIIQHGRMKSNDLRPFQYKFMTNSWKFVLKIIIAELLRTPVTN